MNPRHLALGEVLRRAPRSFARPLGPDGRPLPVRAFFGSHAFGLEAMRARLPSEVVRRFERTLEEGAELTPDLADRIAQAALEWALDLGATHFAHWFHPMTGLTAEKHEAFLDFDEERPISRFTGRQLVRSEPDASSFPSGGMRSTFEARGYTIWDPGSPMFVVERPNGATLCIPSVFVSYTGEALDKKTPLLRSMKALREQAARLCRLLDIEDGGRVTVTAGAEQEYFLVDRAWAALRPDLLVAGRALVGGPAPKGQTLEDHYFGSIPSRVLAFMQELDQELYRLGVAARTRHNEVAPSQFEIALRHAPANVAADHDQLVMEMIRKVARRHDFEALLHEKPFPGVNGSGKHLNWSLADAAGHNLLEPGDTPEENLRFLAVLAAVLHGAHRWSGALRASIASHGNDFRLGANEAPPGIVSVYLGDQLSAVCDAIAEGRAVDNGGRGGAIDLGLAGLARIPKDNTDRNRTSPFAFTGNKFEFRAVGANASISLPLTVLNAAVADGLRELGDRLEAAGGQHPLRVIGEMFRESAPVRYDGNNYAEEWRAEARRRGLPDLRTTPEALDWLARDEVRALFARTGVLEAAELESRIAVKRERYVSTVEIEVNVLGDLVRHQVLPAARAELRALAEEHRALAGVGAAAGAAARSHAEEVASLASAVDRLRERLAAMEEAAAEAAAVADLAPRARAFAERVVPAVEALRDACNAVERVVADDRWPLPRVREMLFQNA